MKYENIVKGTFMDRPNRFIANVLINGKNEVCHVKNTGRCKELLIKGVTVYLTKSNNPNRKTAYDLIAVQKGDRLINMDSQIVNPTVIEYLPRMFSDIKIIKPECKYGNSRFDVYLETINDKIFIECKGVTLENDGVVLFPDAPTERGTKHIKELIKAVSEGYKAYLILLVQMDNVKYFTPNVETDINFANALKEAKEKGVIIKAFSSIVTPDSIEVNKEIEVRI